MKRKSRFIAEGAMIAALYVVLTVLSMLLGLDKMAVQLRFSEALTVLPAFMPSSVMGLFVGCLIANTVTGCTVVDIAVGSLTTLVAGLVTRKLKNSPYIAPLPAIVGNTLTVPLVLAYSYKVETALPLIFLTVFLGELVSAGILGTVLTYTIKRHKKNTK